MTQDQFIFGMIGIVTFLLGVAIGATIGINVIRDPAQFVERIETACAGTPAEYVNLNRTKQEFYCDDGRIIVYNQ